MRAGSSLAPARAAGASFDFFYNALSPYGEWIEVDVLERTTLGAGSEVAGPAVVEFPESTCVVRPGWSGAVDDAGTLVLRRSAR